MTASIGMVQMCQENSEKEKGGEKKERIPRKKYVNTWNASFLQLPLRRHLNVTVCEQ